MKLCRKGRLWPKMRRDLGKNSSVDFLLWLKNRLENRYCEERSVINNLDTIIRTKKIVNKSIDVGLVESICEKLWPGFIPETSEFFGSVDKYSEEENNDIRVLVKKILVEARKDGCAVD